MGFFSDLWDFIKWAGKKLTEIISKIFYTIYDGVKYTVECIVKYFTLIKNSWVGTIAEALSFIFDLLDFLESKGADVNVRGYKSRLRDMDLDRYGEHNCDIKINQN